MKFWYVLAFLGLSWAQHVLTFNLTSKSAFGILGGEISATVLASEHPDFCIMKSPTGKQFCSDEAVWYMIDLDCEQDPRITIGSSITGCQLSISSLAPLDFGPWEVEARSFGSIGVAQIMVNLPMDMEIMMVNAWGEMEVMEGSAVQFTCRIDVKTKIEEDFIPPSVIWKVKDEVMVISNDHEQEGQSFTNSFRFTPTTSDNGKKVSCGIADQDLRDGVTLKVTYFEDIEGEDGVSPLVLEANQDVEIFRVIKVFPEPTNDDITWHFDTPNGLKSLKPGESFRRLSASKIKDLGYRQFQVSFSIAKVLPIDDGKTLVLDVQVGRSTHVIEIPLKVEKPGTVRPPFIAPTTRASQPDATARPPAGPDPPQDPSGDSIDSEELDDSFEKNTEAAVEAPEVQQASGSMNLIIIVAIIALLILLCIIYYCLKWRRSKSKKEEPNEDPIETKPLNASDTTFKDKSETKPETTTVQFSSPPTSKVETLDETRMKPANPVEDSESNKHYLNNVTSSNVPSIVVDERSSKVENQDQAKVDDDTNHAIQTLIKRLKPAPLELPADNEDDEYMTSRTPVGSRDNSFEKDSPPAQTSGGAGLHRQDAEYAYTPASTISAQSMEALIESQGYRNPAFSPKVKAQDETDSKIPDAIEEIKRHVTSAEKEDNESLSQSTSPIHKNHVNSVGVQTPKLKVRDNNIYFEDQSSSPRESLK